MRGLLSIARLSFPDIKQFRKGIIVATCSDDHAERISTYVVQWLPHVEWVLVKRQEPAIAAFKGETFFTGQATTFVQQFALLRSLRRRKADIVVVAWTSEASFGLLKLAGLLSNTRSIIAFNENVDAFFLVLKNHRIIRHHLRWRFAGKMLSKGRRIVLEALSWIFLFPLGVVSTIVGALYLVIRKRLRRV
ncbi:MAG: hypothetical protein HY276_10465 [Ignavibacteriales bacterium]|nr:hypothetical protein [Ignavibacteriales bacterium]